jgi:hypothetical protein
MGTLADITLAVAMLPLAAFASVSREGAGAAPRTAGGQSTPAVETWKPVPLSRYGRILERKPFGKAPPPPPAAPAAPVVAAASAAVANKLVLCAINRTPSGKLAVGFVDGNQNPPHSYYVDVGDQEDGFTAIDADIEQEFAIIAKDGNAVTLWLPGASQRTVSPAAAAILAAAGSENSPEKKAAAVAKAVPTRPIKPSFSTATEQLLSMELSVPAGVESPPLPITDDMEHDVHKALANVIVIETNDTDTVATHKETVGLAKLELKDHMKAGGTTKSYLQTLKDRRDAEIARQKAARDAAEAQIRELAKKLGQEELERQLEAINKNLTDNGVEAIGMPE